MRLALRCGLAAVLSACQPAAPRDAPADAGARGASASGFVPDGALSAAYWMRRAAIDLFLVRGDTVVRLIAPCADATSRFVPGRGDAAARLWIGRAVHTHVLPQAAVPPPLGPVREESTGVGAFRVVGLRASTDGDCGVPLGSELRVAIDSLVFPSARVRMPAFVVLRVLTPPP